VEHPAAAAAKMIAVSASEDVFAFAAGGDVYVWERRKPIAGPLHHHGDVTAMAFGRAGELVTGSSDGVVRLWSWRTKTTSRELPLGGIVRRVAASTNGRYLAALTSPANVIRIWDAAARDGIPMTLPKLPKFERPVDFSFDPSGAFLAVKSAGTIQIWQLLAQHVPEVVVQIPDSDAYEVGFSPDGRWLARDNPLTLIDWRPQRLAAEICKRVERRSLTPEEWAAHLPDEERRPTCVAAIPKPLTIPSSPRNTAASSATTASRD
jgi:hypothetical protein